MKSRFWIIPAGILLSLIIIGCSPATGKNDFVSKDKEPEGYSELLMNTTWILKDFIEEEGLCEKKHLKESSSDSGESGGGSDEGTVTEIRRETSPQVMQFWKTMTEIYLRIDADNTAWVGKIEWEAQGTQTRDVTTIYYSDNSNTKEYGEWSYTFTYEGEKEYKPVARGKAKLENDLYTFNFTGSYVTKNEESYWVPGITKDAKNFIKNLKLMKEDEDESSYSCVAKVAKKKLSLKYLAHEKTCYLKAPDGSICNNTWTDYDYTEWNTAEFNELMYGGSETLTPAVIYEQGFKEKYYIYGDVSTRKATFFYFKDEENAEWYDGAQILGDGYYYVPVDDMAKSEYKTLKWNFSNGKVIILQSDGTYCYYDLITDATGTQPLLKTETTVYEMIIDSKYIIDYNLCKQYVYYYESDYRTGWSWSNDLEYDGELQYSSSIPDTMFWYKEAASWKSADGSIALNMTGTYKETCLGWERDIAKYEIVENGKTYSVEFFGHKLEAAGYPDYDRTFLLGRCQEGETITYKLFLVDLVVDLGGYVHFTFTLNGTEIEFDSHYGFNAENLKDITVYGDNPMVIEHQYDSPFGSHTYYYLLFSYYHLKYGSGDDYASFDNYEYDYETLSEDNKSVSVKLRKDFSLYEIYVRYKRAYTDSIPEGYDVFITTTEDGDPIYSSANITDRTTTIGDISSDTIYLKIAKISE